MRKADEQDNSDWTHWTRDWSTGIYTQILTNISAEKNT